MASTEILTRRYDSKERWWVSGAGDSSRSHSRSLAVRQRGNLVAGEADEVAFGDERFVAEPRERHGLAAV